MNNDSQLINGHGGYQPAQMRSNPNLSHDNFTDGTAGSHTTEPYGNSTDPSSENSSIRPQDAVDGYNTPGFTNQSRNNSGNQLNNYQRGDYGQSGSGIGGPSPPQHQYGSPGTPGYFPRQTSGAGPDNNYYTGSNGIVGGGHRRPSQGGQGPVPARVPIKLGVGAPVANTNGSTPMQLSKTSSSGAGPKEERRKSWFKRLSKKS
jgi:hypothetical protein